MTVDVRWRRGKPVAMVLALAASAAAGCGGRAAEQPAVAAAPSMVIGPEAVTVVQRLLLRSGPTISGQLAPGREAAIRAEIGGSVVEMRADEGQAVAEGELLARIDDATVRDQLLSARSGVRSAELALDAARRDESRAQRLAEAGAVAPRDVETAHRTTAAAEALLADAQARLSGAEQQLARTLVKAPFSGIVSAHQVSAGDVVQPGSPLFQVVDPSSLRLEAAVPAEQLASLRLGSPVDFTVSGHAGRTFQGRIQRISPTVDPATRQVRIFATLPNSGRALVAGLFAEGRVATESVTAPAVPVGAVDTRGASPSVLRVRSGRVERVAVELGVRDEVAQLVQLRSGAAVGDTLLLGLSQGLAVGTEVRIGRPTGGGVR